MGSDKIEKKVSSHKRQHYVPKSYLSAWVDEATPAAQTPYVWAYPLATPEAPKRKSPGKLFTETDIYTVRLPNGIRDLRLEHGLGHLENGLIDLRTSFIERHRQIPAPRHLKLIALVAAMKARTPTFRDHHRQQWQNILNVADDMMLQMADKTSEEKKRISSLSISEPGKGMSMDEVRNLVQYPIQHLMPVVLQASVPIMAQMSMTIYWTEEKPGFITSDNPVVWFDPEAEQRPAIYRTPALMYKSLEITMALSPQHLISITHDDQEAPQLRPITYRKAWPQTVQAMNTRTLIHAGEMFVASTPNFDLGKHIPPEVLAKIRKGRDDDL
jgi:hypothetical protein